MRNYLIVGVLLNMLVELLLLLAANHVSGFPPCLPRCFFAMGIGGIYSALCLLPAFHFMGSLLWRCVFLWIMGVIAYGFDGSGIGRTMAFLLLSMALGGVVLGIGEGGILSSVVGGLLFCIVGYCGLQTMSAQQTYVEVELSKGDKREKMLALRDTGNRLCDPVSGQQVLVADAKSAATLLGLTKQQLRCPVETVAAGQIAGLRLIPYRTVGQPAGLLVGIRLDRVRIGQWQGSAVVAFAPDGLGEGNYRALTGGMIG